MGIIVHCDLCGTIIKNLSLKDFKNFDTDNCVCKECTKKQDLLKAKIEGIKKRAKSDFEKLSVTYKDLLAETIKSIASGNTD